MFSNLASYIFGSAEPEAQESGPTSPVNEDPLIISHSSCPVYPDIQLRREESSKSEDSESDWVVVGGANGRTPALGSLNDMMPRPVTGSTGSSATPSEDNYAGDDQETDQDVVMVDNPPEPRPPAPLTRSGRRLTAPFSCQNALASVAQIKAARSGQTAKLKSAKRPNTAKAMDRKNKAVKHNPGFSKKNAVCRDNLSIKASGFSKQLKQC